MEYQQNKFNREYTLTYRPAVESGITKTELIIENPITINFSIDRALYSAMNTMELDIYNLAGENRDYMYQDVQSKMGHVFLEAGYKGWSKSLIFAGDVINTYSYKSGVNVVTHIRAFDSYAALSIDTNQSFEAGTTTEDLVRVGQQDTGLEKGVYSFKNYKFVRGVSLVGNEWLAINKYVEGNAFIDLGRLYILGINEGWTPEYVEELGKYQVMVIDDSSGLLGTPQRNMSTLTVNMIFEPRVQVGQIVELRSTVEPRYNGQYKIYSIKHNGIISDTVSGQATTTLELFTGSTNFGGFRVIGQSQENITPAS